jgi:plastocyanin
MLKSLFHSRRALALLALTASLLAFSSVVALASGSKTVKVEDNFFSAKKLTIGKGTRVTWKWDAVLRHNVAVRSGPSKFRSRTQVHGTFSHTFSKAGTYHLYCTLHPYMKMTIVVK